METETSQHSSRKGEQSDCGVQKTMPTAAVFKVYWEDGPKCQNVINLYFSVSNK